MLYSSIGSKFGNWQSQKSNFMIDKIGSNYFIKWLGERNVKERKSVNSTKLCKPKKIYKPCVILTEEGFYQCHTM